MTLLEKTKQRSAELGISPKRSLGQNFLVSDLVVEKIIRASLGQDIEKVIEIGPGLGALTDFLSVESKNYQAIELDKKIATYWREQNNFTVHCCDALDYGWAAETHLDQTCVVGNLPYQIASRVVVELSLLKIRPKRMVFMFQKEVAQRILSPHNQKEYGLLSMMSQVFWKPHFLLEAGSVDFMPKPRVASRVVVFNSKLDGLPAHPEKFLKFTKVAFENRRKKLKPRLKSFFPGERIDQAYEFFKLPDDTRIQGLTPDFFVTFYEYLCGRTSS